MKSFASGVAAVMLLAGAVPAASNAQPAAAPTRYMISEKLFLVVEGQTMTIGRDGDRAMSEQAIPPKADLPKGQRSRAYYDIKAGKSWTLDLIDPSTPCGPSNFTGDWGDPFAMSAQLTGGMAQYHPARAGTETVNAIATEVSTATTPDGHAKVWVEPKTGLVVKLVMIPKSGPPRTMIEVTSFSSTPPTPLMLTRPPKCH